MQGMRRLTLARNRATIDHARNDRPNSRKACPAIIPTTLTLMEAKSTSTDAIQIRGLSLSLRGVPILRDIDLCVPSGSICFLLGPNGAGKTSLLRCLLGLNKGDEGEIRILGYKLDRSSKYRILENIGAMIEDPAFYEHLNVLNNLKIFQKYRGVEDVQVRRTLELFDLTIHARTRSKLLSLGTKQRLGLAMALIHDPPVVILDEPGRGLDPEKIAWLRDQILEWNHREGKTFLISSHELGEVEKIAHNVYIIDQGRMKWGARHDAVGMFSIIACDDLARLETALPNAKRLLHDVNFLQTRDGGAILFDKTNTDVEKLNTFLRELNAIAHNRGENGSLGNEASVKQAKLEDIYLHKIKGRAIT
jgi:ABC-type multidrug transport system ATPase subunit